jgi:hypothetical protein
VIAKWLSRLQMPARSERAISEALLDGRHEVAAADSFPGSVVARLRSVVGFAHAIGGAALGEVQTLAEPYWALAVPVVLLIIAGVPWLSSYDYSFMNLPNVRGLAWVRLSLATAVSLPPAVFLAIALGPREGRAPILALLGSIIVFAVGMTLVVVPAAWSHYAEVGLLRPGLHRSLLGPGDSTALMLRSVAALLLADRVRVDPRRRALLVGLIFVVIALFGAASIRIASRGFAIPAGVHLPWPNVLTWGVILPLGFVVRASRFVVDLLPFPLLSALLWYVLVKRQERTTATLADRRSNDSRSFHSL